MFEAILVRSALVLCCAGATLGHLTGADGSSDDPAADPAVTAFLDVLDNASELSFVYNGSALAPQYNRTFALTLTPTTLRYFNAVEPAERASDQDTWDAVVAGLRGHAWSTVAPPEPMPGAPGGYRLVVLDAAGQRHDLVVDAAAMAPVASLLASIPSHQAMLVRTGQAEPAEAPADQATAPAADAATTAHPAAAFLAELDNASLLVFWYGGPAVAPEYSRSYSVSITRRHIVYENHVDRAEQPHTVAGWERMIAELRATTFPVRPEPEPMPGGSAGHGLTLETAAGRQSIYVTSAAFAPIQAMLAELPAHQAMGERLSR